MIYFYNKNEVYFAVQTEKKHIESDLKKLEWLFGDALFIEQEEINGKFILGVQSIEKLQELTGC